jgi:hypothetical protein
MEAFEFDCDDCKIHVTRFALPDDDSPTVCFGCMTIRAMKAKGGLTPGDERRLRDAMGCELPEETHERL